eukprot:747043-Hanusia_phi.AAC.6
MARGQGTSRRHRNGTKTEEESWYEVTFCRFSTVRGPGSSERCRRSSGDSRGSLPQRQALSRTARSPHFVTGMG